MCYLGRLVGSYRKSRLLNMPLLDVARDVYEQEERRGKRKRENRR